VIDTRNPACDELFDSVSQSLFGIGLQLEHCIESTDDPAVNARLDASIRGLHDIIALIRNRGELHCDTACK
jgi:signal transduction histidine kinase